MGDLARQEVQETRAWFAGEESLRTLANIVQESYRFCQCHMRSLISLICIDVERMLDGNYSSTPPGPPAAGREKKGMGRGTPPRPPAMGLRPPAPLAE